MSNIFEIKDKKLLQKSILKNQKTQSSEDSSKLASGETTAS